MRIAIISGSARANNNSLRVAKALQKEFEAAAHEVNLIDFVGFDIPLMAQGGLKANELTVFQSHLIGAFDAAQVVIIISPEYNWSTTPEILNMLHYLPARPFEHLFQNKVFSFVGVSTGKGGKAPAIHLMQIVNKLISFGNHDSLVSSRIFESHFTKEALDENGDSLGNELFNKGLQDYCQYTLRIAQRWFRP
ncbi:MAG: NAD(P)H-dependent oxidoreductase [bacterium]|nr:NAD(P)H-dependent oxidoreductase [bacterium]